MSMSMCLELFSRTANVEQLCVDGSDRSQFFTRNLDNDESSQLEKDWNQNIPEKTT